MEASVVSRTMKKAHLYHNLLLCYIFDTLITIILKPTPGFVAIVAMARIFIHLCAHLLTRPSSNAHISLLVTKVMTKAKVDLEQFTNHFVQTCKN